MRREHAGGGGESKQDVCDRNPKSLSLRIMNIITAVVLGVIQGLTEFLPVSSSGHLVLFQRIFGISEPALLFDTMVHGGTLAAVIIVMRRDIWTILRRPIQPLTLYLIIATIPAVAFALALKESIEKAFETGKFLGCAFIVTAALLIIAELLSRQTNQAPISAAKKNNGKKQRTILWQDALIIGFMQAIAIIPGVSRSGATISGALFRKIDRDLAARFSFLLSIPVILGALLMQIIDLAKGAQEGVLSGLAETMPAGNGAMGTAAILAGTASAALTGFFAVSIMLKIIREKSLWVFAIYTGTLGLLVLLDQLLLHIVF